MNLTPPERETVILFNDADQTAEIYTCNKTWKTKLDKLCAETKDVTCIKEDEISRTYTFPKKWIKVMKPRELSEEEKQKLANHARANFGWNATAPIQTDKSKL